MTNDFLEKITSFDDELGEPLKSGMSGELLNYCIKWSDLKKEQELRGFDGGDDVRVADYVLQQLKIPHTYCEADDHEQDGDKDGDTWRIYWR